MSTVVVKERPILFSDEMVRAILEGRKTQTRRIIRPRPVWEEQPELCNDGVWRGRYTGERVVVEYDRDGYPFQSYPEPVEEIEERRCPYGRPGDLLWVRETWSVVDPDWQPTVMTDPGHVMPVYRASAHEDDSGERIGWWDAQESCERFIDTHAPAPFRWRPSIHMPRWASRITLEITDVRVQRVQDITEDDARAEGIDPSVLIGRDGDDAHNQRRAEIYERYGADERAVFAYLWDRISPRGYAWNTNPWVWAITFRRCA